jgi:hypothetical protein
MKHSPDSRPRFRKAPMWQWIVIILVVIAMPLFFSYYRTMRLQQVLGPTDTQPNPNHSASQPTQKP